MKLKITLQLLLFTLTLTLTLTFGMGDYRAFAKTPAAPKLIIPETNYEFGEVHEGEKVRHHFVMKNNGASSLEIIDVKTD
jgi:uncharacterized protein DUF1573